MDFLFIGTLRCWVSLPFNPTYGLYSLTYYVSQKSVQSKIYVNRSLRLCRRF